MKIKKTINLPLIPYRFLSKFSIEKMTVSTFLRQILTSGDLQQLAAGRAWKCRKSIKKDYPRPSWSDTDKIEATLLDP